jgi:7-cyano-7-deazaguanine synthase
MTIVSLVSGGIDSLLMCKIIHEQGEKQVPIFVNYGQLSNEREWAACRTIMGICKLPDPLKINLQDYGRFIPSGITNRDRRIKEDAFLPGRNLLFLLVASSYAHSKGFDKVAIGLLSEKYSIFPDQTQKFIVNANFAINTALDDNITIATPLISFSKSDVIRLAKKYNLPLSETYSCHAGTEQYCGKCISCQEIIKSGEKETLPQFRKRG